MFGYVTIHKEELKLKEYETYKGFYCGACQALRREYGLTGQLTLSYDLTFLTLLLSSLYEPKQQFSKERCIAHPQKKRLMIENEFSAYAAHMSILLTWYKLLDDWRDEKKKTALVGLKVYRQPFLKARKMYPKKEALIRQKLKELSRLERENCTDIDRVAGTFGHLLGSVFAMREDIWEELLYRTGFFLGKFIYLMDAWEDLEKDQANASYNLWLQFPEDKRSETALQILNLMMSECSLAFEQLPILENAGILRNVLYSGVWTKYSQLKENPNHV